MSKDIKCFDDSVREFDRLRESLTTTGSIVRTLATWIWDNVVGKDTIPARMPPELSEPFAALEKQMRITAEISDNLRWYFCKNALNKWLSAEPLTREEFYLLAAQGILRIPSETGFREAYEEFALYLYEDNERQGYINPSEYPDPPMVPIGKGKWTGTGHVKIGIVPEEVRTSFLSSEQKAFFKEFEPELFARFRKD
jgi:hypothetical protein